MAYSFFCYIYIPVFSIFIITANIHDVSASSSHNECFFFMYSPAELDNNLEVRDSQGKIIKDKSAQDDLSSLFYNNLLELLFYADIHSIAQSREKIRNKIQCADLMFGMPVMLVSLLTYAVVIPSIKKLVCAIKYFSFFIKPNISIHIFPSIILLILSRKLSSVILRV